MAYKELVFDTSTQYSFYPPEQFLNPCTNNSHAQYQTLHLAQEGKAHTHTVPGNFPKLFYQSTLTSLP